MIGLALDGGLRQDLVVSWKEAADRKESVASEALVIPSSTIEHWARRKSSSPASIRA